MRTREGRRGLLFICILAAALLALFLLSFWLGRYDVPPSDVIRILLSRIFPMDASWTEQMEAAVLNIRRRRTFWAPPPARASARRWPFCWAFPAAASRRWPL